MKKTAFFRLCFLLTIIALSLKVSAKHVPDTSCSLLGTVNIPSYEGSCLNIILNSGDTLLPVSGMPNQYIVDGLRVKLSYSPSLITEYLCSYGIPANILCMGPVDPIVVDTCRVSFSYTKLRCSPEISSYRCNGETYRFEVQSENEVTSCLWNFGDGDSSTMLSPVHSYKDSGLFVICLNVLFDNGCAANYCNTIWIGDSMCQADFEYYRQIYLMGSENANAVRNIIMPPYPNGYDYRFVDKSRGDVISWRWELDDTVYYEQNIIHTFNDSGIYDVCLIINTSDDCASVTCKNVYVGVEPGCYASFWYHSSPPVYWDYNAIDSMGNDTPVTPIDTIWPVNMVQFYGSSSPDAVSWLWYFGDSTSSTLQNPVHYYYNSGVYYVCLTVTTASGCTNTYCQTVYVEPQNDCKAKFEYCKYSSFHTDYTDTIPNYEFIIGFKDKSEGNIYSWNWNFGDGNYSYEKNPVHKYYYPGLYTVCLEIYGYNCYGSYCMNVQVGDACNTEFTWDVAFPDCEGYFPAYMFYIPTDMWLPYVYWDFGDGNYSWEYSPVHAFDNYGVFNVCLTTQNSDGCFGTTCYVIDNSYYTADSIHLKNCGQTLTEKIEQDNIFKVNEVFPVPVQSDITFDIESGKDINVVIEFIDIMGIVQKTASVELYPGENEVKLDVSSLSAGQYIYKINMGEKAQRGMIVKE